MRAAALSRAPAAGGAPAAAPGRAMRRAPFGRREAAGPYLRRREKDAR